MKRIRLYNLVADDVQLTRFPMNHKDCEIMRSKFNNPTRQNISFKEVKDEKDKCRNVA